MHMIRLALFLAVALAGGAALAQEPAAAGDAARGAILADTCMGCHGIPGYRNAYPSYRVPKLGGQSSEYIVLALQGYKNQTRPHNTMHAQAAMMPEQEMRDVAAFFASEGQLESTGAPAGPAPEKAATCVACHGEGGVSATPAWPSLAGQHRDYLVHALNEYNNGVRKDPVMGSQAIGLTPAEIQDLAAYYAGRPGVFTVHYSKK
jgi:cytochrome c553